MGWFTKEKTVDVNQDLLVGNANLIIENQELKMKILYANKRIQALQNDVRELQLGSMRFTKTHLHMGNTYCYNACGKTVATINGTPATVASLITTICLLESLQ